MKIFRHLTGLKVAEEFLYALTGLLLFGYSIFSESNRNIVLIADTFNRLMICNCYII